MQHRHLLRQVKMQIQCIEIHPFIQCAAVQSIALDDEAQVIIDDVGEM